MQQKPITWKSKEKWEHRNENLYGWFSYVLRNILASFFNNLFTRGTSLCDIELYRLFDILIALYQQMQRAMYRYIKVIQCLRFE